jgi:hypothetical protein
LFLRQFEAGKGVLDGEKTQMRRVLAALAGSYEIKSGTMQRKGDGSGGIQSRIL